jgi:hypothetical protein
MSLTIPEAHRKETRERLHCALLPAYISGGGTESKLSKDIETVEQGFYQKAKGNIADYNSRVTKRLNKVLKSTSSATDKSPQQQQSWTAGVVTLVAKYKEPLKQFRELFRPDQKAEIPRMEELLRSLFALLSRVDAVSQGKVQCASPEELNEFAEVKLSASQ